MSATYWNATPEGSRCVTEFYLRFKQCNSLPECSLTRIAATHSGRHKTLPHTNLHETCEFRKNYVGRPENFGSGVSLHVRGISAPPNPDIMRIWQLMVDASIYPKGGHGQAGGLCTHIYTG